jgi:3-oxoacyl-[acyl-carrier protein] reductase
MSEHPKSVNTRSQNDAKSIDLYKTSHYDAVCFNLTRMLLMLLVAAMALRLPMGEGAVQERAAIVTGAAAGIGRAIAERLYADGASVVLADINGDGVAAIAAGLDPSGERVASIPCDASRPEDAQAVVDLTVARFGSIQTVVPCAGVYRTEFVNDMSDAQWRGTMSINLDGVFYLCRRALPHMSGGGAMVLVASVAAHMGGSLGHVHYGATKGAVVALARGLARELGPNVRVNAVSPGLIETAMTAEVIAREGAARLGSTPLARYGQPSEVAAAVSFLCGQDSSYITGEVIHVNGGSYMG